MAIRSGSGALKYPLPANTDNQASIASASAGGSASSSAYGTNRRYAASKMQTQAQLANSAAERQFRAMSQLEGQNFQAQSQLEGQRFRASQQADEQQFRSSESQLYRDFQAEQSQIGRDFQSAESQKGRDFSAEQGRIGREFQIEQDEREYDRQIQQGIQSGQLQLSPEAQKEMDKLESGRAFVRGRGDMSDEQKAEFYKRADAKEREILRGATRPQGPTATGQFNQGTIYYDPQTGQAYPDMQEGRIPGYRNKDGGFQPHVQAPDTSKEDAARKGDLEKRADAYVGQPNPNNDKKPYTMDEAIKQAMEDRKKLDSAFGPPPQGQQAPQPQGQPTQPFGAQGTGRGLIPNQPQTTVGTGTIGNALRPPVGAPAQAPARPARQPTGQAPGRPIAGTAFDAGQTEYTPLPAAEFDKRYKQLAIGGKIMGPDGILYEKVE